MVKVALCFYGQPRYANNLSVPQSYVEYFNKPEYELGVYGHCWYERNAVYKSSSWTQDHEDYKADDNVINRLYQYYSFDRFMIERPRSFRLHNETIREKYKAIKHEITFSDHKENNTLSQLYSIQTVANIVPDYFDFYVLCRYDTTLTGIPDLTTLDPEKAYFPNCGNFSDIVIILGRKFLTWPRKMYTLCQEKSFDIGAFIPEELKRVAFLDCGFNVSDAIHIPMFGHISRTE